MSIAAETAKKHMLMILRYYVVEPKLASLSRQIWKIQQSLMIW